MTPARIPPDTNRYSGRFAERLRKLREKNNLSQEDLAKILGVALSTIYRWEAAQSHPDPDFFPTLTKALGLANVRLIFPLK